MSLLVSLNKQTSKQIYRYIDNNNITRKNIQVKSSLYCHSATCGHTVGRDVVASQDHVLHDTDIQQ